MTTEQTDTTKETVEEKSKDTDTDSELEAKIKSKRTTDVTRSKIVEKKRDFKK